MQSVRRQGVSKGLSYSLIGLGVVLLAIAAVLHFVQVVNIFPHFTVVLGVVGVVVAVSGIMGMVTASKA